MEYGLSLKDKTLSLAAIWINVEDTILSKKGEVQTDKGHMI